jgi:hypothetical protein
LNLIEYLKEDLNLSLQSFNLLIIFGGGTVIWEGVAVVVVVVGDGGA